MSNKLHLFLAGMIGVGLCFVFLYSKRNKPVTHNHSQWPTQRPAPPVPQPLAPTIVQVNPPPLRTEPLPLPPPVTPTPPAIDPFAAAPLVANPSLPPLPERQPAPRIPLDKELLTSQRSPPETELLRGLVRLEENDSLWRVAERAYGSSLYYKVLYEHNRHRLPRPDQIREGDEVEVPELTELAQKYPTLVPRTDDRFRPQ